MEKIIRYIKTYIDNEPKILCLNSCNLCPFLVFDKKNRMVRCSRYTFNLKSFDNAHSNIINTNINAYSISGNISMPLTNINIPEWCNLSRDIETGKNEVNLYFKTNNNKSDYVNNIIVTLPVISSYYTQYNRNLIKLETISKNLPAKFETDKKIETQKNYPILKSCSCCGQMKDKIDRDKNIGMCDDCWEKYKDDKDVKYYSYVNNFRLKRNSTWVKEINKKVEEKL